MNYNKKIPLEQEKIQLIIKSFEDGEFEYIDNFKDHPTVTQNGRGAAIWNNIHTQLVKNFSTSDFKTGIISRGPWDLIYVYDCNTKYLYTFMRTENFSNLHKGNMAKNLYHYSNVLSRLNGELLEIYEPPYQQMSFVNTLNIDGDVDAKLDAILKKMVGTIDDEIERYALVLVECRRGIVSQIECVIPIAYMNPMYREDWSEYINAEYMTEEYHVEETLPDEEAVILYSTNEDVNLSLRDDVKEKKAK